MIWHSTAADEVLASLEVDAAGGLANGVADLRLEQYGKNVIEKLEKPTFRRRLADRFREKTVIFLIVVALISSVLSIVYEQGNLWSPLLIIGIVLLNALISAIYLYRSDNTLNSLESVAHPTATVLRDGISQTVPADCLVPGDILLLHTGDFISADARLIEATELRCSEQMLTGESVPMEKHSEPVLDDITPIEQRVNMVYSGTSVIHGNAKAVVVGTGLHTEVGHTSAILQQSGKDTLPLQKLLDQTGKTANIVILILCVVFFCISILQNFSVRPFASMTVDVLLQTVALAVAAIPEGLPAIATVVIALGVRRIVKDNIIIKKADAVELLGKTTVICTDKTGVLTRNKMALSCIYDGKVMHELKEGEPLTEKTALTLRLAAACSTLDNDSTEHAIQKACLTYNSMSEIDLEAMFPRLNVIPFDGERKTMTTLNMVNGKPMAIVKGAPELLLPKCVGCETGELLKVNEQMAENALRVVCLAIRPLDEIPANPSPEEVETELCFVGLLGLTDPPRDEAIESIEVCGRAGVRTVMITGDNLLTARMIARRIGILKEDMIAVTGDELRALSDEELQEKLEKIAVYARISPADKLRIVEAWQTHGDCVAVTGDGIEDADALATADIGCAVGRYGTDVARGSADIIITGSNFGSIVAALRESRGLFANIRKSVSYLLSCNFGEILAYLFGAILFRSAPLAAVQLLWINLLTDCAPAISLSMEKAEKSVMTGKPGNISGRLFDLPGAIRTLLESVFICLMTLLSYRSGLSADGKTAATMAFVTLGLIQIFHCYNCKCSGSIFSDLRHLFDNRFMAGSTALTLFLIMFFVFTPVGFAFGLQLLTFAQFGTAFLPALAVLPFAELEKLIIRLISRK